MRIDTLNVQNFRCYEKREFCFAPQFNVLIGDNGSGKTALLDALAVAAGSWLLGLKGTPAHSIRLDDVRLVGHKIGEEITFDEQYPVKIRAEGWVNGRQLNWERALNTPDGRTTHGNTGDIKSIASGADKQVRDGESVTLPLVAYYGTGRLWHTPKLPNARKEYSQRELSRFTGYRDSLAGRIDVSELSRWMERQDRIAYQERREPQLYQAVRQAIRQAVEQAVDARFDNKRLEVIVAFQDGSFQPFSHLSDGQRNVAALVGDIAMRMAKLNPHLMDKALTETPGIVLIDELDLHLHPKWQRHIVTDLRTIFPLVQFVATTHSPFIIQSLREGELSMLEGQPVLHLENLTLDAIARGLMDVPEPQASERYLEMRNAAKDYLLTLDAAALSPKEHQEAYEKRLHEDIAPYADNPAFQAFLELKRTVKLGK